MKARIKPEKWYKFDGWNTLLGKIGEFELEDIPRAYHRFCVLIEDQPISEPPPVVGPEPKPVNPEINDPCVRVRTAARRKSKRGLSNNG